MISKSEREQIIALIKKEVVPAIGCTEPIAVALCVAKATETLGKKKRHGGWNSRYRNDRTSYSYSVGGNHRKV